VTRNPARRMAALLVLMLWIGGWSCATQLAATHLTGRSKGTPLCVVAGRPVFAPWKWYFWAAAFPTLPPQLRLANAIGYATFVLMLGGAVLGRRLSREPPKDTHGSARWSTLKELRKAGFGCEDGVVLCQSADAQYRRYNDADGKERWRITRHGELITDNSDGHVFFWTPSGGGKLISFVVPTALNWRESIVVYDTKREIWPLTAGWRSQYSRCLRFEPAAKHSVRINPLFQIPRDERDVAGAQTVATTLCRTHAEQNQGSHQHWKLTATDLITGAILHVLYAGARKSLAGVRQLLAGDGQAQVEVLLRMASTPHLGDRPHPQIVAYATAGLNMAPNERSGVFSSAISELGIFLDPRVAANTDVSDFSIEQLVMLPEPVSLYLVVEPGDEERMRPLIRLLLDTIGKALMRGLEVKPRTRRSFWARLRDVLWPAAEGGARRKRWRLLWLIDEMPTLGRLPFFELMLAAARGYGMKLALIAQSLNQVEAIYGTKHSINDNANTQLTSYARAYNTAKHISDMLGQYTATETRVSTSRKAGALFADGVTESEHAYAKPLLSADDIMHLPYDEVLLSAGGLHPYRGKKIMDYLDERFDNCTRAAPESVDAQRAELPVAPEHGWNTEPIEPALDALAELKKRFGIKDPEEAEGEKAATNKKAKTRLVIQARDAIDDAGAGAEEAAVGKKQRVKRKRGKAASTQTVIEAFDALDEVPEERAETPF
jgi:type IV secretion system protein VirD4